MAFTFTRTQVVITLRFPEVTDANELPPTLLAGIDVPELRRPTRTARASSAVRDRLTTLVTASYGKQFARVTVQ